MRKFVQAVFMLLLISTSALAQRPDGPKVKVSGNVIERTTRQPLEYATITFSRSGAQRPVAGGISDPTGAFNIEVPAGTYDITIEFISFKPHVITAQEVTSDLSLGTIELSDDATQLNEVVVRAEQTTVEIKLDKKVYNVGQDLMVKGGTVSDVLDNIPSVAVDSEGTVTLRGNENVRILIDGRPTNAINIAEALRMIPADAIEKVEVVTNPSARYDSEGGGGLLNIILKKGKNLGLNGTVIASAGHPESYGLSGNINYKTEDFNLFTTTGYNHRTNPGNGITNTEYLNPDGSVSNYINERRENERLYKSFNTNFGMEWYIDPTITWTNQFRLRKNNGSNDEEIYFDYFDQFREYQSTSARFSNQDSRNEEAEFSTNFMKKFKKDGHTLMIDGSFSDETSADRSLINAGLENTRNDQKRTDSEVQVDYVLPLGEDSRFEAGYSGDFLKQLTDFEVQRLEDGTQVTDARYSNILDYRENINAIYSQYGTKFNKISVLLGLRWEDSNIDINQLTTDQYINRRYNNFFPSAFVTYEISDRSNIALSYSRRISRPRGRMINPFSNYSSNINIFRGNPEINPAFTNSFDLGYLHRWNKLTFNTSMYLNRTTDAFQFIRRESGFFTTTQVNDGEDITDPFGQVIEVVGEPDNVAPVMLTTPINLATEYRFGFEFTLNYSPYKWWRLNSNFNFFRNETQGEYTYTGTSGEILEQDFDNVAYSWFTRLTSKVTLPHKIEWQTNMTYNAPQTNAQGRSRGIASMNLAFSKDILNEKATLSLNVQDVFNSRKRIYETNLPFQNSYSEMQWRVRSINFSLTYRFNRKKNERDRQPQQREDNGDEMFGG